ncbi:MAG: hypothetical protein HQL37_06265 [Alphaproteobacteria bacterium]|nr:hypothetical protein [Alphaproteobacteria bacterium]
MGNDACHQVDPSKKILLFSEWVKILPGNGDLRPHLYRWDDPDVCGRIDEINILKVPPASGIGAMRARLVNSPAQMLSAPSEHEAPLAQALAVGMLVYEYRQDDTWILLGREPWLPVKTGQVLGWTQANNSLTWETRVGWQADPKAGDDLCLKRRKETGCQKLERSSFKGKNGRLLQVSPADQSKAVEVVAVTSSAVEPAAGPASPSGVDVILVVDGTNRMQPMIDWLKTGDGGKGILGVIQQTLTGANVSEAAESVRLGFVVYGDTDKEDRKPYGREGIGATYAILNGCQPTAADIEENNVEFKRSLMPVMAQPAADEHDDYPENLFGGLIRAFQESPQCSNRSVVFLVFGDAGYDVDAQRDRLGLRYGISPKQLSQTFVRLNALRKGLSFIRMPPEKVRDNQDKYNDAHELFRKQAETMANTVNSTPSAETAWVDYNYLDNFPTSATGNGDLLKFTKRALDRVRGGAAPRPDSWEAADLNLTGSPMLCLGPPGQKCPPEGARLETFVLSPNDQNQMVRWLWLDQGVLNDGGRALFKSGDLPGWVRR